MALDAQLAIRALVTDDVSSAAQHSFSDMSHSLVAQSVARQAVEILTPDVWDDGRLSVEDKRDRVSQPQVEQAQMDAEGDMLLQEVARDVIAGASLQEPLRASPVSQVPSENTDSLALSVAKRAIAPLVVDSSGASPAQEAVEHSVSSVDPSLQGVARDAIAGARFGAVKAESTGSQEAVAVSEFTDSIAAQSITRQLLLGIEEDVGSPVGALAEDVTSEGYATKDVARAVVVSATQQWHGQKSPSHVSEQSGPRGQSVAREVIAVNMNGALAASFAGDTSEQVLSEMQEDAGLQAYAKDVIAYASAGTPVPSKTPPSQHDSDHADSVVAQNLAKHILESHAVASLAADQPEQVHSDAEGYVAQRVSRDFVASASSLQQGRQSGSSQIHSEKASSAVAQSIARQVLEPSSDDKPADQVPEDVTSEGYAARDVARDVVVSAARQRHGQQSPSHVSEQSGLKEQSVAREVIVVNMNGALAASFAGDTSEQVLSEVQEDAGLQAYAKDVIAYASAGTPVPSKTPPSQHDSDHADSVVAQNLAKHILESHAVASLAADQPEQVHSDAEGYVAQRVSRDFVASASSLQQGTDAYPSQIHSERASSAVAQSIARQALVQSAS